MALGESYGVKVLYGQGDIRVTLLKRSEPRYQCKIHVREYGHKMLSL